MHLPFWLTTALLFPVFLYQGKRARKSTPRLPEAQGSPSGHYGEGQPHLRLLVIGESTAASVGVTTHDQGLASQLALRDTLAAGYPGPVYLLSVPPIHLFTALPAPLRQVMGWRARQLNRVYEQLARQAPSGFRYLTRSLPGVPNLYFVAYGQKC